MVLPKSSSFLSCVPPYAYLARENLFSQGRESSPSAEGERREDDGRLRDNLVWESEGGESWVCILKNDWREFSSLGKGNELASWRERMDA